MINTYGKKFVSVNGDRVEEDGTISQPARYWLSATEGFSDFQVRSGLSYLYETHTAGKPVVKPEEFRVIVDSLIDSGAKNSLVHSRIENRRANVVSASRVRINQHEEAIARADRHFFIGAAFIATALISSLIMIFWVYL